MPKPLRTRRVRAGASRLVSAAVIGFSFTFVAAGIAMLLGLVPQRMLPSLDGLDATVLLLFVPLCALTLAILGEAVRSAMAGSYRRPAHANSNPLEPWRPGQGEG